jgi:predicted small lipoprotein YifL
MALIALVFATLAAAGCKGGGEYIPPLKPVGDGVPGDLPALEKEEFAALRIIVNG